MYHIRSLDIYANTQLKVAGDDLSQIIATLAILVRDLKEIKVLAEHDVAKHIIRSETHMTPCQPLNKYKKYCTVCEIITIVVWPINVATEGWWVSVGLHMPNGEVETVLIGSDQLQKAIDQLTKLITRFDKEIVKAAEKKQQELVDYLGKHFTLVDTFGKPITVEQLMNYRTTSINIVAKHAGICS